MSPRHPAKSQTNGVEKSVAEAAWVRAVVVVERTVVVVVEVAVVVVELAVVVVELAVVVVGPEIIGPPPYCQHP